MPGSIVLGGEHRHEALPRFVRPLEYAGLLDSYKQKDLTPVIGREYEGLQVEALLNAENSDDLIRDLAVTGSRSPPLA